MQLSEELLASRTDPCDQTAILRCLALAHRVGGQLDAALDAIARAETAAAICDDAEAAALVLATKALIVARAGQVDEALRLLSTAEPNLSGPALGELNVQRALILLHLGRFADAHDDLSSAIARFANDSTPSRLAAARMNRALASAFRGDLEAAASDSDHAQQLFDQLGDVVGSASVRHNRAWMYWLGGSIFNSLALFASAIADLEATGFPTETIPDERCQALLSAGLLTDAIDVGRRGVRALSAAGNHVEAADMRAALAVAYERAGDAATAKTMLDEAHAAYRSQGRVGHATIADIRRKRLSLQSRAAPPDDFSGWALGAVATMRQFGNPVWSGEARLLAARALIAAHRAQPALEVLRGRFDPMSQRIERDVLRAAAYLEQHRPDQVLRNVRRALRTLDTERDLVGAMEVRASMSMLATEAVEIGGSVLASASRAGDLLELVELAQGRMLDFTPRLRSPELIEHRALDKAISDGDRELRDVASLHRRRSELERGLRQSRQRHRATNDRRRDRDRHPFVLSLTTLGDNLIALRSRRGRTTLHTLGLVDELGADLRQAAFVAERCLEGQFEQSVADEFLAELDARLFDEGILGSEELRILPGATAVGPILGLLPSLRDRDWACGIHRDRVDAPAGADRPTVLVAGTDIATGVSEVTALQAIHPHAVVIPPQEATIDRVVSALDGAGLVHFTAHSEVNTENPMLSSIRLADGPLPVYELLSLKAAPRTVVLASCRSSASVPIGAQAIGLAQAFLAVGVRDVVGSALPIPDDDDTSAAVAVLHRHLGTQAPAAACRRTRMAADLTDRQRQIADLFQAWTG